MNNVARRKNLFLFLAIVFQCRDVGEDFLNLPLCRDYQPIIEAPHFFLNRTSRGQSVILYVVVVKTLFFCVYLWFCSLFCCFACNYSIFYNVKISP